MLKREQTPTVCSLQSKVLAKSQATRDFTIINQEIQ